MQKSKIDIVLPHRIGDSIMSLPSLLCLKQLFESYDSADYDGSPLRKITLFSSNDMTEAFQSLNIFDVKQMSINTKIKSWFSPADLAFFLYTSSKNMGFRSKISYGEVNPHKKYARYSINRPYLSLSPDIDGMPQNLISFLKDNFGLSNCSIRSFWICLDLGFSDRQIIDTFDLSPDSLNLSLDITLKPPLVNINYLVFCMEAAYGKTKDTDRRWKEEYFYALAEKAHENYNLDSVFIGIDKSIPVPQNPYFIDLRSKLTMSSLIQVLKYSKGYVGNDTGPLHIANLLQKKSIGIYFRENSTWDYNPIFPHLNRVILKPDSPEEVFEALENF